MNKLEYNTQTKIFTVASIAKSIGRSMGSAAGKTVNTMTKLSKDTGAMSGLFGTQRHKWDPRRLTDNIGLTKRNQGLVGDLGRNINKFKSANRGQSAIKTHFTANRAGDALSATGKSTVGIGSTVGNLTGGGIKSTYNPVKSTGNYGADQAKRSQQLTNKTSVGNSISSLDRNNNSAKQKVNTIMQQRERAGLYKGTAGEVTKIGDKYQIQNKVENRLNNQSRVISNSERMAFRKAQLEHKKSTGGILDFSSWARSAGLANVRQYSKQR